MQIKALHKNIYRLSRYTLSQQKLEHYRKRYESTVKKWEKLKKAGNHDKIAQEFSGISRATYFRNKARLQSLAKGSLPPTKKPKTSRKPLWGESERQAILRIRRENPTYGKAKIAVILKRDHALKISESTVGRILETFN